MADESKHVVKFKEFHLKSGENIIVWGIGYIGAMMGKGDKTQYNGVLIVTGERVVFYRKGILGEVLETIPLKKITSIERKSIMGHRTIRIHTSHDQLEFKTFEKDKEIELIDAIESGRNKNSAVIDSSSRENPLDILKYLSELKDSGVITEKEFKKKKEDILSKI